MKNLEVFWMDLSELRERIKLIGIDGYCKYFNIRKKDLIKVLNENMNLPLKVYMQIALSMHKQLSSFIFVDWEGMNYDLKHPRFKRTALSQFLQDFMEENFYTQAELAKKIGINSKGMAFLLLSDEMSLPEGLVEKIAKATHVTSADIIFLLNKRYDYYDEQDYERLNSLIKCGFNERDYATLDYLIKNGCCNEDYPVKGIFKH